MTIDDLSRLAYTRERPTGATGYEMLLWYQLRDIYEAVRTGKMTKPVGAEEKQKAIMVYEMNKSLVDNSVNLWKRIEQAGIRYAGDKTIENADLFYEAVYRIKPGLPERIKKGGDTDA